MYLRGPGHIFQGPDMFVRFPSLELGEQRDTGYRGGCKVAAVLLPSPHCTAPLSSSRLGKISLADNPASRTIQHPRLIHFPQVSVRGRLVEWSAREGERLGTLILGAENTTKRVRFQKVILSTEADAVDCPRLNIYILDRCSYQSAGYLNTENQDPVLTANISPHMN
jgi:hypothetical protein